MAINRGTLSRLALPAKLGIGGGALGLVLVQVVPGPRWWRWSRSSIVTGPPQAGAEASSLRPGLLIRS